MAARLLPQLLALACLSCVAPAGRATPAEEAAQEAAQVATEAATPSARPRNVLLVVIDTLRADRLGCYGYARPTTPRLDALAARGLCFERAYATAPWTLPSTASLLTGLQPEVHRASHFFASISPEARLLAESFEGEGYATAAFVGNYFVQPLFGFERGFDRYDQGCMVDRGGINSDRISDAAIAWLSQPRSAPFFLYLHYFDPHYNYWEHDGFKFGGEDTERVFSGADIYALREQAPRFDAADRARLDALYDSEVAFTDHHVGRVFDQLEAQGIADDTFVVVTADHGESLGEHGWIGHTVQLYEESIRIPLLVAGPGLEAARHGDLPVQLDDVLVPLLRLAGGEEAGPWSSAAARVAAGLRPDEALCTVETSGLDESEPIAAQKSVTRAPWKLFIDVAADGTESYRLFKQDEPAGKRKKRLEDHPTQVRMLLDARAADLEALKRERERNRETLTRKRALVQGRSKVIVDLVSGAVELFDLVDDPQERKNLATIEPERAAALQARLREVIEALAAAALPEGAPLDDAAAAEHRKRIQASGYSHR
ncbi:MAG: sulfatase [Planctomycetes bacterium]|nr:sulfatase [Planctomycetota bacterium]